MRKQLSRARRWRPTLANKRGWAVPLLLAGVLVLAAQPAPQLTIVNPVLHNRQEDAPAIPANYSYYGGELLYLSFKVSGFKPLKEQVEIRWQIIATDQDGLLLVPLINGVVKEELNVNDKEWLPRVQHTIPLPPQIPPGMARLKLIANDEHGKTTAEKTVEFRVGGRPLPKVEGFSLLDLGFYRERHRAEPDAGCGLPGRASAVGAFSDGGIQAGRQEPVRRDIRAGDSHCRRQASLSEAGSGERFR